MKKMFLAVAAASFMISSAAYAAVTYDPATGGFAGKGDIQSAFGWNNTEMQAAANQIDFLWEVSGATYEIVCEFDTQSEGKKSEIKHHVSSETLSTSVSGTVQGDPRAKRQDVTGFNLGAANLSGSSVGVPSVGDPCKFGQGNSFNDAISAVNQLTGGSVGGLYAIDTVTGRKVLIYAAQ